MRRWAFTAAILLVLAGAGGFLVVVSGIVPIKASSGHWPITVWFMEFAMRRSVSTHTIGMDAPPLDDRAFVLRGAGHYDIGCRPCHGSPELKQPTIARGMTPLPPYLGPVISQYEPEGLFYVVKHGVKFTGMPAWPAQQRDDEVWAMVAFLRKFPELDAAEYLRLVGAEDATTDLGAPLEDLVPPREMPRAIAGSCARCHGADGLGRGVGAFPILAGQRPVYLHATLRAYAKGDRHSGIMEPLAAALNEAEMREIAAYYSGLEGLREPPAGQAAPDQVARGRSIATSGIPERLVPPCAKCHGPSRERRNPHYPRLAGQYPDYLRLQLSLFKSGRRGGTEYRNIMRKVAGQLTDDQIRSVAEYYGSLAPQRDR